MPWIVFLTIHPVLDDKDSYNTWSGLRDWRQLCMYVHRALWCHCRQQIWISTLHTSHGLQLWCKTREQNAEVSFNKEIEEAHLPTDSCLNNSMYKHKLVLRYRKYRLSLSSCHHRALMASFQNSRQGWRQSVFTKFHAASCHCFASLLLSPPVMIRSSWEVPDSSIIQWFYSTLHICFYVHDQR